MMMPVCPGRTRYCLFVAAYEGTRMNSSASLNGETSKASWSDPISQNKQVISDDNTPADCTLAVLHGSHSQKPGSDS